jgi:hypothetical protein
MMHAAVNHVLPDKADEGLTVIDGGHFTLRRSPGDSREARAGGLFYVRTLAEGPALPREVATARCFDDPALRWSVCRVSAADVDAFVRACPEEPIHLSGPTRTETETLRRALAACVAAREAGEAALLRIMVGNLGVPAELRHDVAWAMPDAYRAMIAEAGPVRWRLIRESHCRNAGGRHARERFKRLLDRNGEFGDDYPNYGYGIMRVGASTLYLIADSLLDLKGQGERAWALALTKDGTRPTCGVTLAGCLVDMMALNATRYIAFHDRRDDTRIHDKIIEGVLVAAYLEPTLARKLVCEVHTLSGGEPFESDVIDFSKLGLPGVRPAFADLVADTRRRMRKIKIEWTEDVNSTRD